MSIRNGLVCDEIDCFSISSIDELIYTSINYNRPLLELHYFGSCTKLKNLIVCGQTEFVTILWWPLTSIYSAIQLTPICFYSNTNIIYSTEQCMVLWNTLVTHFDLVHQKDGA